MKARQVINGAAYGPEVLKALGQAFDETWEAIAGKFGQNAQSVEAARLRLANALLSSAREGVSDVEGLKSNALRLMAFSYAACAPKG